MDWNQESQKPIDRHNITARVFQQKLKSLMSFIIKHRVYRQVRCCMYSVEWQKRSLSHTHILVWLVDKIRPNKINSIISTGIPDKTVIYGSCGVFKINSPFMVDDKCSKRYPRNNIAEIITGNYGYLLYITIDQLRTMGDR